MIKETSIKRFAEMPPREWRTLAMKATWYFRTEGEKPLPATIDKALGQETPTHDEWLNLCRRVTAMRRAIRIAARKQVLAERREKRRLYMQGYMKTYRKRKTGDACPGS